MTRRWWIQRTEQLYKGGIVAKQVLDNAALQLKIAQDDHRERACGGLPGGVAPQVSAGANHSAYDDELAHAIIMLLNSPDQRTRLGQRAMARALSKFTEEAFLDNHRRTYDHLAYEPVFER